MGCRPHPLDACEVLFSARSSRHCERRVVAQRGLIGTVPNTRSAPDREAKPSRGHAGSSSREHPEKRGEDWHEMLEVALPLPLPSRTGGRCSVNDWRSTGRTVSPCHFSNRGDPSGLAGESRRLTGVIPGVGLRSRSPGNSIPAPHDPAAPRVWRHAPCADAPGDALGAALPLAVPAAGGLEGAIPPQRVFGVGASPLPRAALDLSDT
jgi:hypothetical protein